MQVFLHDRVQACSGLQRDFNSALQRFNAGDAGLALSLASLLERAAGTFARHRLTNAEAQVLELKAQLLMAGRGIDPVTLVRQSGHRRELAARFTFRVLTAVSEQLRHHLALDDHTLQAARQQLANVLLAGIQGGLVAASGLDIAAPTAAAAGQFWRAALKDAALGPAARQVAMAVTLPDILLLLLDLLAALAEPTPPSLPPSVLHASDGVQGPAARVASAA